MSKPDGHYLIVKDPMKVERKQEFSKTNEVMMIFLLFLADSSSKI